MGFSIALVLIDFGTSQKLPRTISDVLENDGLTFVSMLMSGALPIILCLFSVIIFKLACVSRLSFLFSELLEIAKDFIVRELLRNEM